jgi:hypothetical protein
MYQLARQLGQPNRNPLRTRALRRMAKLKRKSAWQQRRVLAQDLRERLKQGATSGSILVAPASSASDSIRSAEFYTAKSDG